MERRLVGRVWRFRRGRRFLGRRRVGGLVMGLTPWSASGEQSAVDPWFWIGLAGVSVFALLLSFLIVRAMLTPVGCGIGFELVFVLPPILWLRNRRKRRA